MKFGPVFRIKSPMEKLNTEVEQIWPSQNPEVKLGTVSL